MATCRLFTCKFIVFATLVTIARSALTKIRLEYSTDQPINIVFGEANTLAFDLDVVTLGTGIETGAELSLVGFLVSGGGDSLTNEETKTADFAISLSAAQDGQAIDASDMGGTEISNVFSAVDVTLDLTGDPACYDTNSSAPYELICITADGGPGSSGTIIPDTYCLMLDSCKSIITVGSVAANVPTLTATTGADLAIIYGTSKDFTLDITTTTGDDTTTAVLPGTEFAVEIFLATSDTGDNASHIENATVTPTDVEPSAEFVLLALTATIADLSGLNCDVHTHVCASINPAIDAPWQWGSGTDPKIACVVLVCTSEIEADPAPTVDTTLYDDLDILMGVTDETFNLSITLTTGHNTAQIGEADLFDLFVVEVYIASDENGTTPTALVDGTVTNAMATIEPDVNVADNPIVINVIAAAVVTSNLNCDDFTHVCVNLNTKVQVEVTWANASTDALVACVAITECEGKITATSVAVDTNGAGNLEMVMGAVKTFDLDIDIVVAADSAEVDANGDNMFYIEVYLSNANDGTNPSPKMVATGITTSAVTMAGGATTELVNVQADVDTDGFPCDYDYVCVDVAPKSTDPFELWSWTTGELKVACVQFTACTEQVTENTTTVTSNSGGNLDIVMGTADKVFILDIIILTDSATGEITDAADALFDINVFLAPNGAGNETINLVAADTIAAATDVTIDTMTNTTLVTATVDAFDLTGLDCDAMTHICINIGPTDSTTWDWTVAPGTPKIACVPLGICTSVITDGTIAVTSDDLTLIIMGKRKVFTLEVTIPVTTDSALVTGLADELFAMEVYLANADSTTVTKNVTADPGSEYVIMEEGQNTVISNVGADMVLYGLNCNDYTRLCVDVSPYDAATWSWHDAAAFEPACVDYTDCSIQVEGTSITIAATSGTDLNLIMGTTKIYDLDITIVTGEQTGLLSGAGNALFDIEFFLYQDGGNRAHVTTTVPVDDVNIQDNHMTTLTSVDNTDDEDDLLGLECSDWTSLCVAITPIDNSGWEWANSVITYQACTDITGCTTVLTPVASDPITISANGGGQVSIAMGASETLVLDVSIETDAATTGKLTDAANVIFDMVMFLALDTDGSISPAVAATLPSTDLIIAESTQNTVAGVTATLDLTSNQCSDFSLICVNVSAASAEWSWYEADEAQMGCVVIDVCTTAPTISVSVANDASGDLDIQMGESKTFHLDVTVSETLGDEVSGTDLYTISAYLATSSAGSNPKPSAKVTATIADNTVGFTTSTPAVLSDVQAVMSFTDSITCQHGTSTYYNHVCVDLSENSGASPLWGMTAGSTSTACVQLSSCTQQTLLGVTLAGLDITAPTSKKVTQGEDVDVTFDVTATSTAGSSSITGNDNWKIEGFLATSSNGAGATTKVEATTASMTDHVGQNLNSASSYTFSDVIVTLPPQSECGDLAYFCVELTQSDGATWYFDPFYTSSNVECTAVTCGAAAGNMVCVSLLLSVLTLFISLWFNV